MTLALGLFVALAAQPQMKIAFSDGSRPGTLKVGAVRAGITVRAYAGNEVLIDATRSGGGATPAAGTREPGMRAILGTSADLTAEEENNVVTVRAGRGYSQIVIQVPARTSVKVSSVHAHSGKVVIEGIDGEVEVSHVHGSVELKDQGGSAVVHSVHGSIAANFRRLDPARPMSFSSVHGKIDVTLPADAKADLSVRSHHGTVYSDFESVESGVSTEQKTDGSRRRTRTGSVGTARINGGGAAINFSNLHGSIYVRKAK